MDIQEIVFFFGYLITMGITKTRIGKWNEGNEEKKLERACIISDVTSFGDSLGIIYILDNLNLPGKIGLDHSAKVFRKGFSLTSKRNPNTSISKLDSFDSFSIDSICTLLLAANLTFFYNTYFRLSIGPTSLACCNVEV